LHFYPIKSKGSRVFGSIRSSLRRCKSALQNILEKSVRELGAIRLIDSRIGVPGQLACNPRVILGRFRTTIRFAWLHILVLWLFGNFSG
jgi:hypothetical protein